HPGGGEIHRALAEVGVAPEAVLPVGGGDGGQIRVGQARWDESAAVDVGAGVAGRGHYQDSMLVGVVDRVGQRPRIGGEATQGEVDHIRTDVGGVGDG